MWRCYHVMKLGDANLQVYKKSLSHTSPFMYFAFIFSECITITSSEEALKVWLHNFFQEIQAESCVTFNLPVQLRFLYVNFLHIEYGIWSSFEYSFCQINWYSSFLAILVFFVSGNNCRPYGRQKLLSVCVSIWMEAHKICIAWVFINQILPRCFCSYVLWLNKLISASQPI